MVRLDSPLSDSKRAPLSFTIVHVHLEMGSHIQQDMYYDASRSPGAMRHPHQQHTLHRASSRHFDPFSQIPGGLYTAEDHAARYEPGRFDRPAPSVLGSYGYDMPASQTWNPSGFGGVGPLAGLGGTGRMKPSSRQRSGLPPVSLTSTRCSSVLRVR